MGQPALEPHIYLSPSLGPCSLLSETPKSQVGSLLTCLSLSRRASESSLSSESSESSVSLQNNIGVFVYTNI